MVMYMNNGLFPFINPISAIEQSQTITNELPLYKEYAYDFINNCLKFRDGNTYLVEGNEAIKIWIYKALHTARYRHIAYSPDYGNECDTVIGEDISLDILQTELQRFIIEALMVNPYIVEVSEFAFEAKGERIRVRFTCETIYGTIIETFKQ